MEDKQIVALYWKREERAITASEEKYGPVCRSVSYNILQSRPDAEECVPAVPSAEEQWEAQEVARAVERWLQTLDEEERDLFLRRYWCGEAVKELAAGLGCSSNGLAQRLRRLRQSLRQALEKEGVVL